MMGEGTTSDPPMALCPRCEEPLVATFYFPGYEFVCMGCGKRVEFFGPKRGVSTPELEARQAEHQAAFDEFREQADLDWAAFLERAKSR